MDRKSIIEVARAQGRQITAVVATLNTPDVDHDVVKSGFFSKIPMESLIVPAHRWDQPSLGKAVVYERGNEVHAILGFNGTSQAAEWFEAIRHDFETGSRPLQQYSWGFSAWPDAVTRTKEGRELHARKDGSPGIRLFEISPVLVAASVNTRTTAIKSATQARWRAIEARLRKEHRWR